MNSEHPVFRPATTNLVTAIDFCPVGCVNLHFGSVVVHLSSQDFLALATTTEQVARHLARQMKKQTPSPAPAGIH